MRTDCREQACDLVFAPLFEPADLALDQAVQPRLTEMLEPGLEPHQVVLDLLDEGQVIGQRLEPRIGRQPFAGLHEVRAGGNQSGVDPVVLGPLQTKLGKGADL